MKERLGWLMAAVLAVFVVASVTGVVSGGPLDPPGAPGSTGRPLEELSGAWSQHLPADDAPPSDGSIPANCNSSRFKCVFNNDAVLDLETGLVWTRFVPTNASPWGNARAFCVGELTGNRGGWRLPTVEELTSLTDPSASAAPYLPVGHPFVNVVSDIPYWTSSEYDDNQMWLYWFDLSAGSGAKVGFNDARYWCVRGGPGQHSELPTFVEP